MSDSPTTGATPQPGDFADLERRLEAALRRNDELERGLDLLSSASSDQVKRLSRLLRDAFHAGVDRESNPLAFPSVTEWLEQNDVPPVRKEGEG